MKEHDRALAHKLASDVRAQPRECYRNALLALIHVPGGEYIEGLLMLASGPVIYHGWLETQTSLLDVTLHNEQADHYVPVLHYTQHQIWQILNERDPLVVPLYNLLPAWRTQMIEAERNWWAQHRGGRGDRRRWTAMS